jgi:hypothetical protein
VLVGTNNTKKETTMNTATDTITINNVNYEKVLVTSLREGDVVLATYNGGSEWGGRHHAGGYWFETDEYILTDGDERIYNRVQRWEVAERDARGFNVKRAKSGTFAKYTRVTFANHFGVHRFAYKEVK